MKMQDMKAYQEKECTNSTNSTQNDWWNDLVTCPNHDGYVCQRSVKNEPDFGADYAAMVLAMVSLFFVWGCLYFGASMYARREKKKCQKVTQAKELNEYQADFLKRLMPRISVPNYQFRGIQEIPESRHVSLKFQDLSLTLNSNGKCCLDGVNGEIRACTMTALMGPSGAGKTTLLNVLCGKAYYGETSGDVWINGKQGEISQLRSCMGFVPQDDIVFETLTVAEQISYSARLRNPPGTSKQRIRDIVNDVLTVLQMRHIQDSIVGSVEQRGISGGQRKRVNIALELASCPTLLFLDEPTSGLDSTSALDIIQSLKQLTTLGMTVVMVIHQPRYALFELFDEVLLLGVGGRTVYQGPAGQAETYFESLGYVKPRNDNPADWFMDIIAGHDDKPRGSIYADLFEAWQAKKGTLGGDRMIANPSEKSADTNRRMRAAIAQTLDAEWDRIDTDSNGSVDRDELIELFTRCAGGPPSDEVFEELWKRMGGDDDSIDRVNFTNFFTSLAQVAAKDSSISDDSSGSENVETSDEDESLFKQSSAQSTPGFLLQLRILFSESMVMYWRNTTTRFVGFGLIGFAATVIGFMTRGKIQANNPAICLNLFLAEVTLSLLCAITALGAFGNDRPLFWRLSASGINRAAFYIARIIIDSLAVIIETLIFTVIWYICVDAQGDLWYQFFVPFILVAMVSAAFGYLVSIMVPPQNATLAVSIVVMILGAVLAQPNMIAVGGGNFSNKMSYLSWGTGMSLIAVVEVIGGADMLPVGYSRQMWEGYMTLTSMGDLNNYVSCIIFLGAVWIILLFLGHTALVMANKNKQI
eukprot:TRINITY_DN17547_c4_g1_i1.p1 TRINITY_DN17547_c4_g1~~TRINITY_DN17547_c4_g1_i1.p1  ORF type:complete len:894 (+),score=121.18 TRINITY_DN17547_c4_g1_i1:244-2682(+)